eukprot:CAMPEP_0185288552 /NCGR_PEP_ID=MMETSP1363-20130426/3462_1 /TAXON_ID=38817 /ORGANISM="Gephyrocapsa oceanica, Strain RCC1303" /LENGTH=226 /DNA_ID=CAMNT_0027884431 /DNA_START=20 /DNA_END=697 /DNA_ORIENTATION=+
MAMCMPLVQAEAIFALAALAPRPALRLSPTRPPATFARRCSGPLSVGDGDRLSIRDLRSRLARLGVDSTGVFERAEIERLIDEQLELRDAAAPSAASSSQWQPPPPPQSSSGSLAPPMSMHVQDVISELEERGVAFNVLEPHRSLARRLEAARAAGVRTQTAAAAATSAAAGKSAAAAAQSDAAARSAAAAASDAAGRSAAAGKAAAGPAPVRSCAPPPPPPPPPP